MGYDCTLHVVDQKLISETFVEALLDGRKPASIEAEHWNSTLRSLAEDPPKAACSTICQLALIYASRTQLYHCERGFALCLWPDQPDGLDAQFPVELTDSPEMLFEGMLKKFPQLKGNFPVEFSGNWSTGVFISAKNIGNALKWVEACVEKYSEGDRELFRGLILVLQHCAKHNLAYWEGTDLPIPEATMEAEGAGARRAARSFKWPNYGYVPMAQHGDLFVCQYRLGPDKESRTALADFSAWPPQLNWLNEYATSAAFSAVGNLVTVASEPDAYFYTIRLRKKPYTESESQKLSGDARAVGIGGQIASLFRKGKSGALDEIGYDWAGFFAGQVVGLLKFKKDKSPKRFPQFQQGSKLVDDKSFAAAKDNHKDHFGNEHLRVGNARMADGAEVFIWRDGGWESINGRFQKTFALNDAPTYDNWCSVAAGPDGFYFLSERCLFEIHRGAAAIRHLPKLTNIMQLKSGPENSLLLKEGDNKAGDWGKLYWPDSRQITRLKPELVPDVPGGDLLALHWLESQKRLLVFSTEEVWFVTWEEIQQLPRTKVRE